MISKLKKSDSFDKNVLRILIGVLLVLTFLFFMIWILGRARAKRDQVVEPVKTNVTEGSKVATTTNVVTTEPFKISENVAGSKTFIEINNGSKPEESRISVRMEVSAIERRMTVYRGYKRAPIAEYVLSNNSEAYDRLVKNLEFNGFGNLRDDGKKLEPETYCPENRHYKFGFATNDSKKSFIRVYAACDDNHFGNTSGKVVRYGDYGGDISKTYQIMREQFPDYSKYDTFLGL